MATNLTGDGQTPRLSKIATCSRPSQVVSACRVQILLRRLFSILAANQYSFGLCNGEYQ